MARIIGAPAPTRRGATAWARYSSGSAVPRVAQVLALTAIWLAVVGFTFFTFTKEGGAALLQAKCLFWDRRVCGKRSCPA